MDYVGEQEMEMEALEAILMDDMKEVDGSGPDGCNTEARCFSITIAPKDEDEEEPTDIPIRLSFAFAHTPEYPDAPPLLKVRSVRGVRDSDLANIQAALEAEAQQNLGMAMIFTLAQSAKVLLREVVMGSPEGNTGPSQLERDEAEKAAKQKARMEGTPVTAETWNAWFDRFKAEKALAKAKALSATDFKQKLRQSGKAFFESNQKNESSGWEEELDDADYDQLEDEEFDDELLDEFLAATDQNALAAGQQAHESDT